MPNPFTSQVKIVPGQEQQHISVGLESLTRNLSKIQNIKDLDDQTKMVQFDKLTDISLEGFWQRDKDELFQGEQDYLDNVAKAYKDAKEEGSEGMLPYRFQAQLDKEKAGLMAKLEQSKADAIWYKDYVKQVAWDKTGKIDIEASIAPLEEWLKKSIEKRAKVDKTGWMKRKQEEINLMKEIGDETSTWLKEYESDKLIFDDEGNVKWKETYEGVSSKSIERMAENIKRNESWYKSLKEGWKDIATQQKYSTFDDYVKSHIPYQPGSKTISGFKKPGSGNGDDKAADIKASRGPTTDMIRRTPGDPKSPEVSVTSLATVPVRTDYTHKGKAYKIEDVKVLPTALKKKSINIPGGIFGSTTSQKKGDFISDDALTDNTSNVEYKPYVIVSCTKEVVVKKAKGSYDKDKVKKTKVYEIIPYDDDVKAFLIKSNKFGKEGDDYISGALNQGQRSSNDDMY